jgi:hypothetical protein
MISGQHVLVEADAGDAERDGDRRVGVHDGAHVRRRR